MKLNEPQQLTYRQKLLRLTGLIIILTLCVNIAHHVWGNYFGKRDLVVREACDLRQTPCTVTLPNGQSVKFEIEQKTIPVEKSIKMNANLKNINPDQVVLFVIPLSEQGEPQQIEMQSSNRQDYSAETKLKRLNAPKQEWLAIISIYSDQQSLSVPYHFEASDE